MSGLSSRLYRYNTALGNPVRGRRGLIWLIIDQYSVWRQRSRQRSALSKLDDRLLRDIGIGRADAEWEVRKWFWQP